MSAHDQLEQRLRAAVRARRPRRRRWPLGAALAVAVGAGGAATATTVLDDHGQREAIVLAFDVRWAADGHPACRRTRDPRTPAAVVAAPPSAAVVAAVPVLRRPPTDRERVLTRRFARGDVVGRTVLARGGRLLRGFGEGPGTFVLIGRDAGPGPSARADPAACAARRRTMLARLGADEGARVVAAARARLDREDRLDRTRPAADEEILTTVQLRDDGRMSGTSAGPVTPLVDGRGLLATTLRRAAGRRSLEIDGLLAARVDRVRVEVLRRDGPITRRTVPLRDGRFRFVTPLARFRLARIVLLAADGRELGTRRLRW